MLHGRFEASQSGSSKLDPECDRDFTPDALGLIVPTIPPPAPVERDRHHHVCTALFQGHVRRLRECAAEHFCHRLARCMLCSENAVAQPGMVTGKSNCPFEPERTSFASRTTVRRVGVRSNGSGTFGANLGRIFRNSSVAHVAQSVPEGCNFSFGFVADQARIGVQQLGDAANKIRDDTRDHDSYFRRMDNGPNTSVTARSNRRNTLTAWKRCPFHAERRSAPSVPMTATGMLTTKRVGPSVVGRNRTSAPFWRANCHAVGRPNPRPRPAARPQ